jgi:hypothetical protein
VNRVLVSLALACAVSPCFAVKARVDFDHGRDFSHYKTYRWVQLPDAELPDQLMQARIARFVEEALSARGLRRVETGGDLLVGYETKVREEQQFYTFTDGFGTGGGWCWGGGWGSSFSTTTVQTIPIGTLVIQILDARQNRLVFRGASTTTISSKPERNTKKFQKGVNEIFEKFPPRT